MQVKVRIRPVNPDVYEETTVCPYDDCDGTAFKPHQLHCPKGLGDPHHEEVEAKRYRCLRCHRTFRVYPQGVSQAQQSDAFIPRHSRSFCAA